MKTTLQILGEALAEKTPVLCQYDGKVRIVHPHAIGATKDLNMVARVWQTQPEPAWRMLQIEGVQNPTLQIGENFEIAAGYKVGDRGMTTIIAQQLPAA